MDKLIKNQNFDLIMALADREWDIFELVFGFLNHDTIEICRKVSKDWDISLEKISRVKFLEEFGHKKVDDVYDYGLRLHDTNSPFLGRAMSQVEFPSNI